MEKQYIYSWIAEFIKFNPWLNDSLVSAQAKGCDCTVEDKGRVAIILFCCYLQYSLRERQQDQLCSSRALLKALILPQTLESLGRVVCWRWGLAGIHRESVEFSTVLLLQHVYFFFSCLPK